MGFGGYDTAYDKLSALYEKLEKKNRIMREALEKCLYYTSMRDPQVNNHKQACDLVEEVSKEALKECEELG